MGNTPVWGKGRTRVLLDFDHHLQTYYIFGKDAQARAGAELKKRGAQTVLLHHDSGRFLYDSGLLDALKRSLMQAGLGVLELGGVMPNPRVALVREGISLCRRENVDTILAVGGGGAVDSAKAIAIGVNYDGDVWDFYIGHAEADPEESLPVAVVLTHPATGSESSTSSVLTNDEDHLKRSYGRPFMRPILAFLNPTLTFSLSPYLTACGVADMFARIAARYFSPRAGVSVNDYLCEGALRSLLNFGPKAVAEPGDYEGRAEIMWIGAIAHNGMLGVGRVQDWAALAMGHELSALYDTAPGATLSIMIPAWMRYVYRADLSRFARYALEVFRVGADAASPEGAAQSGIEHTETFFRSLGLPVRLNEANIPTNRLEEMAKKAVLTGGDAIGRLMPLCEKDVLAIYRDAAQ
jgi:alcohol dehydrogenase YqhD (iron-dependent ADH family)